MNIDGALDRGSGEGRAPGRRNVSLCVIVPIYNESLCLPELFLRLKDVRDSAGFSNFTVIFVDDGSSDDSPEMLRKFSAQNSWVRCRLLTRNFGHQIAVTAGLDVASADFVAIIDGDLQDPPELLPLFVDLALKEGVNVVYGKRLSRPGESRFKQITATIFYRVIRLASGLEIPADTGDFRVVSNKVAAELQRLRESHRFIRGVIPWLGFSAVPFHYHREVRHAGDTKYPIRKMLILAADAITGFSVLPIRLVQMLAIGLLTGGGIGLIIAAITGEINGNNFATLFVVAYMTLLAGIVLLGIGIVGGYVHRIQSDSVGRPLYVVDEDTGAKVDL